MSAWCFTECLAHTSTPVIAIYALIHIQTSLQSHRRDAALILLDYEAASSTLASWRNQVYCRKESGERKL